MAQRVLIVGGGVIGLSTALWAARRGLGVTVVDQGTEEGGGCSYGNAGMIVPSHVVPLAAPGMVALGLWWMWNPESPFYVRPRLDPELFDWGLRFWRAATAAHVDRAAPLLCQMHLASRRIFQDWAAEGDDDFGLVQNGLLMLCRTPHGLAEEARLAERARGLGVPAEVLSAAETRALEPGLAMDVVGAVRYPLDAHLTPSRLMAALRRKAERAGVSFSWGTTVTGWRVNGARVEAVRTIHGERTADEYVLAAGVWSTTVARDLGVRLPMQAGKGLSLTLQKPRRLPAHCALLSEARVAVTPMGDTLRVGGMMELAGIDTHVSPARVRGLVRSLTQYLSDFAEEDFRDAPVWCGLRPCSPDGLPYLGRLGPYQNLVVATGHAMMGVSLGPVTGKLVAEILFHDTPSLDVRALRPDRHG